MNSIESVWRVFLDKVIHEGVPHTKDDGDEILECIDNHCFISNVVEDVVMEGQPFNLNIFLKLIGMGAFNIKDYPFTDEALLTYVTALDDVNQIYLSDDKGSFVYTYPERLFNIHQATREDNVVDVNQVEVIVGRLREFVGSNRGVANLYMCALDGEEQHIPCLNFVQALIRDDKLQLHVLFRSNDLYTAFPSNMLFLMYLGLKITEELKSVYPLLKFEGIYYNSTSLHIYKSDLEQARRVLR